jgi:hypothetical protein
MVDKNLELAGQPGEIVDGLLGLGDPLRCEHGGVGDAVDVGRDLA